MKRLNCKIDAWLAAAISVLGVVMFVAATQSVKVACVPMECKNQPGNPSCARNWDYQSTQCESEVLAYPDVNFHILLVLKSILFLVLLVLPIFYGNKMCIDLFMSFSSLWKLRNDEPITRTVEWKRKMLLQLEQLKTSTTLSKQYAIYHTIGAFLDGFSLLTIVLHSFHFAHIETAEPTENVNLLSKATSYFSMTKSFCHNKTFYCEMPNRNLYLWFSLFSTVLLTVKLLNRLLCIGFSLGIPGLFGRNMLLYANQIVDRNQDRVFFVEDNPLKVILIVFTAIVHFILVAPIEILFGFFQFYFCKTAVKAAKIQMADEQTARALEVLEPLDSSLVSSPKENLSNAPDYENWNDLFFVLDVMSGYIDVCEILIFVSKTDDKIIGIEEKKVDIHNSNLDPSLRILRIHFTTSGVVEQLMEHDASAAGGVTVRGWLEGPAGDFVLAENGGGGKLLTFKVTPGVSYQLVSALFVRGRQLLRMNDYKISVPQQLSEKLRKRYRDAIPLVALIQAEARPLSINWDIRR